MAIVRCSLPALLVLVALFGLAPSADAALRSKSSLVTKAGATRVVVKLSSKRKLPARARPRAVQVKAGGRTYKLGRVRGTKPPGTWRSAAYRGAAAKRLLALAGKRLKIVVRSRAGKKVLRTRLVTGAGGGPEVGTWLGTLPLDPGVTRISMLVNSRAVEEWGMDVGSFPCNDGTSSGEEIPRGAEAWANPFLGRYSSGSGPSLRIRDGRIAHSDTFVKLGHFTPSRKVEYVMNGRFTSSTALRGTVSVTATYNTYADPGDDNFSPIFGPRDRVCRSGSVSWSACWHDEDIPENREPACLGRERDEDDYFVDEGADI